MISAIVAVDNNYGIGSNNNLLVHIPEDLNNFKRITSNSIIIMGRKTYDSLPKKPLPNRANIVISSNVDEELMFEVKNDGSIFIRLDDVKKMLDHISKNPYLLDIYIIGGGTIYKELLPYCEKAYVTKINHSYDDVDTYFPNIDKMQNWKLEASSDIRNYNNIEYQFCLYRKRD